MCCHLENFVQFNLPADGGHHGPLVRPLLHLLASDEPHRLASHHQVTLLNLASACYISPQPSAYPPTLNLLLNLLTVSANSTFSLLPTSNRSSGLDKKYIRCYQL